jgi:hypothetical protein
VGSGRLTDKQEGTELLLVGRPSASGQLILNRYSNTRFENPGATPSISANGKKDAIVWAIATKTWNGAERPAILFAFDANNVEKPIYASEQNGSRDRAGSPGPPRRPQHRFQTALLYLYMEPKPECVTGKAAMPGKFFAAPQHFLHN